MKVVILAGGLGTRMREETEFRPKPMVDIGGKPVLWHIMKLFAHHGYNEFIILTGYKSEVVKEYFFNYQLRNYDISLTLGNRESVTFHGEQGESDWKVSVIYTGLEAPTGERLLRAREHIGDETFLCTYGDSVSDVNVSELVRHHRDWGGVATLTSTRPTGRFGVLDVGDDGLVRDFKEKPELADVISIGYFVFEPEVFRYLEVGVPLEEAPLTDLAQNSELSSFHHSGFWQPMDTYREYKMLNSLWNSGQAPWASWESPHE